MSAVRAAVMKEPFRLELERFPAPDPEPGCAVLRLAYSGICGTDKHTFRGESLQYAGTPHEHQIEYPLICGHENVGVIEAVGPDTVLLDGDGRELSVGDRVVPAANVPCGRCFFCLNAMPYYMCERMEDYGNSLTCRRPPGLFGGWAEQMYLLPGTRLFRVPDELPDEVAVLTEVMSVTHGLDSAAAMTASGGGLRFGDTVVVLGVGPLGLLHLAKAELLGAGRLIASDRFPSRLELARRFGADLCLDVGATDRAERVEAVLAATAGRGADVVVDCTGMGDVLGEAIAMLRMGGTLIEPGAFVDMGPTELNVNRDLCMKNVQVIGVAGETLPAYDRSLRMMARHLDRLPFREVVTHRLPLEQAQHAVELAQTDEAMKVVLSPAL